MHIRELGKDVYDFDRTMDVMEKAADNPDGGGLIGAGMGLGAGLSLGSSFGQQFNQLSQQMSGNAGPQNQAAPPPIPGSNVQYFVYHENQQYGPYFLDIIKAYIAQKTITGESMMWKAGMANWEKSASIPDISALLNEGAVPPPPPPPPVPKK